MIILLDDYENKKKSKIIYTIIIYTIVKLKQIGQRELFHLEHILINDTKDIFMNY